MRISDIVKIPADSEPLYLAVKVIPRAERSEYIGAMDDGTHRVRLRAVPEKGRANAELLDFLRSELSLGRDYELEILSWAADQRKLVRIRPKRDSR